MKKTFFIKTVFMLFFQFYFFNLNAQITIDQLFQNTYQLYESQRQTNGVYRDAKLFTGTDYHPCSVANTGTGLISLCIADKAGLISDAETKTVQTLKTILGYTSGFNPDRNSNGFYRHFIDLNTGARAWNSEYSTIDTALLAVGALFAKKYFSSNTEIAGYADELFLSVDWVAAIDNPTTGSIWLELDANGNGQGTAAKPFNEYMIVAYLAMKSEGTNPSTGTTAWNVWTQLDNFAYANYWGHQLLSDYDATNAFRSDFIIQFPYYLVPWAHNSALYKSYMSNTASADKLYYNNIMGNYPPGEVSNYEWGLGAGSSPATIGGNVYTTYGYHADDIGNHPAHVVSPHIVAGFIPIDSNAKNDLQQMLSGSKGLYNLPTGETLLWRYGLDEINWVPNEVQGIDYSSMLYGLAYDKFGASFFATYNDYDFPTDNDYVIRLDVDYTSVETNASSGAACAKMILDYQGNNTYSQSGLHTYGVQNNDPVNTSSGFFDPKGLKNTLNTHELDVDYNYLVHARSNKETSYADMCYWISRQIPNVNTSHMPSVVPTGGNYNNWILVNGFHASANPQVTSNYTVYGFYLKDPTVSGIGSDLYIETNTFGNSLFLPISSSDQWNGKFISVNEPPEVETKAKAPRVKDFFKGRKVTKGLCYKAVKAGLGKLLKENKLQIDIETLGRGKVFFVEASKVKGAYYLVTYGRNKSCELAVILDASKGFVKSFSYSKSPDSNYYAEMLASKNAKTAKSNTSVSNFYYPENSKELKEDMQYEIKEGYDDLFVSPNPASNYLNLDFNLDKSNPIEVSIYNIQGKRVKSFFKKPHELVTKHLKLNISDLSNGVYFLHAKTETTVFRKKFIIYK